VTFAWASIGECPSSLGVPQGWIIYPMADENLTVKQAFSAMRHFLEQYNARAPSEAVEQLLR